MPLRFFNVLVLGIIIQSLHAQCIDGNENIWNNTWESCQSAPNPNSALNNGHWIQYDFGTSYILSKTRIWNANMVGQLNTGFKNVRIDYSENGQTWISLGEFEFPQGTGEAIYPGFAGPDFEAVSARYVLITALSNWGHPSCYGLAEVKFNLTTQDAVPEEDDGTGGPLPIELLSFEAKKINTHDVLLEWQTSMEYQNDYFELLKSNDGRNWRGIGTKEAVGNSTTVVAYSFIDSDAFSDDLNSSTLYYRLQAFDLDGSSSFSDIKSVENKNEDRQELSIYPNPCSDIIYFNNKNSSLPPSELEIYNELGELVFSKKDNLMESVNIANLTAGFYTLSIKTGQKLHHFKIIKI